MTATANPPTLLFQADAALGMLREGSDEVAKIATQTVELPCDEHIAMTHGPQASRQSISFILLPRRLIPMLATGYSGFDQRVSLKVERLAAVGSGCTCIADQRYISTFCTAVLASPVLGVPFGSISKIWASSCATGRC